MLASKNKKPGTFVLGSFCDPGGILTPNRWSRNPVRYTVAPQSRFWRVVQKSFLKVAPQSRFWRVVQKSFFKVAPPDQFHVLVKNRNNSCKFTCFFKEEFIFSNNFERNPFTKTNSVLCVLLSLLFS